MATAALMRFWPPRSLRNVTSAEFATKKGMMPTQRFVSSYNLHFERQGTSMREMLVSKKRDAIKIKITNTQSKSAAATSELTKWLDKCRKGILEASHAES